MRATAKATAIVKATAKSTAMAMVTATVTATATAMLMATSMAMVMVTALATAMVTAIEDSHHIQITAGGNLIKYPGELLTRTANLTTSKLMWNSVLSTKDAKYMCLDIKNFDLSAPLIRYKYMKMPLELFLEWI